MCQGKYRRVVVTDHGKVHEVNSRGEPILEGQTEEHSTDPVKESQKISLQEVLSFIT